MSKVIPILQGTAMHSHVTQTILDVIGRIPGTGEHKSRSPAQRAEHISSSAAVKAGLAAGTMAMPPGLAGMLTLIPELLTVWRIQTQMVADIAAVYGETARLTPEKMLYCLFKATAATTVGTLVAMVGESILVRRPALGVMRNIAEKIGIKVSQRFLARGVARWLPVLGAVGVGGWAYFETRQIGQITMELFQQPNEEGRRAKPAKRRKLMNKAPSASDKRRKKTLGEVKKRESRRTR